MAKKKSNEEFIKEVYNLVGDEYSFLEEYKNTDAKILCKHNVEHCGYEWKITPSNFLKGRRCPKCAGVSKKTNEEFKQEIYDLVGNEYTFLEEYKGANIDIECIHNECNHKWKIRPSSFLRGNRCPECFYKSRRKTNIEFHKEVYELTKGEYKFLEKYKGNNVKIKCRHNTCGNEYYIEPGNFLQGRRCPICSNKEKANKLRKTQEEFERQVYELTDGEYKVLGKYFTTHTKILMEHMKCNHKWYVEPNSFLIGTRCPRCISSSGETIIARILNELNIESIPQHTFEDCRNKHVLQFDFYLPDYNLLIEYDGEQHFKPVNFGGISDTKALENFEYTMKNDNIKNEYCKDNNIPILRIAYWEFDNIEKILHNELKVGDKECQVS